MKTTILSGSYPANIVKMITLLFIFFFWFFWTLQLNAYAAGAPERPSTTGDEKRENANMHFEKGLKLQEAGHYKEASEKYQKAVRADATYAEAWSNLGFTYRKQGYFDKAVKAYKKAIRLSPNLAEAHEYLGEAYAEMGKFDLAEKELNILRGLDSHEADELAEFIAKSKAK
jgi:tetratricopeptide (TPR) repeat protein